MKSYKSEDYAVSDYEKNRIQDFNTADFLYFKNFIRIAKAAEWKVDRGNQVQLCASRECFFFGNVDDGEHLQTRISATQDGRRPASHYAPDGKMIFLCLSAMEIVSLLNR